MLRRLAAAALGVLVQFGAISAPFMHVHLDADENEHHHGQALHAHLFGHDVLEPVLPGTRIDHQDEAGRTVTAQIFVASAVEPFDVSVVAPPAFVLAAPPAQPRGRTPHVTHGHDPPDGSIRSPRAPPFSLS